MNTKAFNKLRKLTHFPIASLSAFKEHCPLNQHAANAPHLEKVYNATNGRPCKRCLAAGSCEIFKTK